MEIQLEIDGKKVIVSRGATIMEAANKLGIYIPHFCYHEKLSIAANCRMCMVDVEKSPKAVPACATPAVDGMVVQTHSERAKQAQHGVMEFLLINHPLDCPICDQGGECQLQDLAVGYGISRSRYQEEKRVVFEKNLGPLIATDMTRCIHCTRCVRFGREIAGIMELGLTGRGEHAEIMPFIEQTVDSEISGNMIDICPVGALTSKPFRYTARPWELTNRPVIGAHDSWGSHLTAQIKDKTVKRVLPDRSPGIHEHWISDRDRFSYEGLRAPGRAVTPTARQADEKTLKETTWHLAMQFFHNRMSELVRQHGAEKIGFFLSPRTTCEEAFLVRRIAEHFGCPNIDHRLAQRDFALGEDDVSGINAPPSEWKEIKTVCFIGAEPGRELPLLASYLRRKAGSKSYLSVSSTDISAQLPLKTQVLARPDALASLMVHLVSLAGGEPPPDWDKQENPLFSRNVVDKSLCDIGERLKKAGNNGVLWLGDIARTAPQYGVIQAMAKQLSALFGCRIGTLADGANGVGLRRSGALPGADGMNTAAMLRANLRGVVLFRCEPDDFCEADLAEQMLMNADFVCAVSAFTDGVIGKRALLVLPVADFAESEGTYINGFGETATFAAATVPPGEARPGWKICRLLGGEYLKIAGIDFTDFNHLHAGCASALSPQSAPPPSPSPAYIPSGEEDSGLCRLGGMPLYGGDGLTRRAAALQKTAQGRAATTAAMHPDDMSAHGLGNGDEAVFTTADEESGEPTARYQTTVFADPKLAPGVIRLWTPALSAASGIRVQAAAAQQKSA